MPRSKVNASDIIAHTISSERHRSYVCFVTSGSLFGAVVQRTMISQMMTLARSKFNLWTFIRKLSKETVSYAHAACYG